MTSQIVILADDVYLETIENMLIKNTFPLYNYIYYVTAIRDHFCQIICGLMCKKGPLLKYIKNTFL